MNEIAMRYARAYLTMSGQDYDEQNIASIITIEDRCTEWEK